MLYELRKKVHRVSILLISHHTKAMPLELSNQISPCTSPPEAGTLEVG